MDGARFDRLTRSLASRRGVVTTLVAAFGQLGLGPPTAAATCKALGRTCSRNGECCSKTCLRPEDANGRPVGRKRCLCRTTLKLPCGGRCCTRDQTCKRGRCVHHCRDERISGDETDRDCGGSVCKKCEILQRCDVPSDCVSGQCARIAAFNEEQTRCVECTSNEHCGNAAKPFCNTFDGEAGSGGVCAQCVVDDHCQDEAAPFCEVGTCVPCRDEVDCPPGQFCVGSPPVCSEQECFSNADCGTNGCCDNGRCANLSDDPSNCGRCGKQCPGEFPQCVMCCGGTCRNPPRQPDLQCFCP